MKYMNNVHVMSVTKFDYGNPLLVHYVNQIGQRVNIICISIWCTPNGTVPPSPVPPWLISKHCMHARPTFSFQTQSSSVRNYPLPLLALDPPSSASWSTSPPSYRSRSRWIRHRSRPIRRSLNGVFKIGEIGNRQFQTQEENNLKREILP